MAESKTKSAAAKKLADKNAKPATKKVAAKALASDKPNQAVAETVVQETHSKARDLVEVAPHAAKKVAHAVEHTVKDVPHIAEEATELVADGAEAVAHQFTQVAKVSRRVTGRDISLVLAGFAVGAVAGGYVGFRIAEKKMRTRFDELLAEETNQVREHYRLKLSAREGEAMKPSIEDLTSFDEVANEKAQGIIDEMGYVPPQESATLSTEAKTPAQIMRDAPETERMREVEEEARNLVSEIEGGPGRSAERAQFVRETQNIFAQRDAREAVPEWDYAVEVKNRDPRLPYVIHVDEWRQNEREHEQLDLTYYEGDNVLCGDNDVIIDDVDEAIGLDNLNRFGHGGADKNTVHIRNEVREIDYEVVRSHGSFSMEVHGIDPNEMELRHSDRHGRGRQYFSDDD